MSVSTASLVRTASPVGSGLENVVAADTALSEVDGAAGRLVIAGHLVDRWPGGFTDAAAALWSAAGLDGAAIAAELGTARARVFVDVARADALRAPDAMDALRAVIAGLTPSGDAARDAATISAAVGVAMAAWCRRAAGLDPIAPEPAADHAADVLRMATGDRSPTFAARAHALDRYLMTVSDHGMNASTFAARVVASTRSDAVSAIVAAIGALKGPLHGGAPGPVLDMLDAIGKAEHARDWLVAELAAGRRIMGMGHRVYRVRDPRAAVLESALAEMERTLGKDAVPERLTLARAVEREATALLAARHPERALAANVEFYTAVLLEAVGIPRGAFTAMFAAGRVAGWTAHVVEQQRTGRLIRPASRYVGARAE